MSHKDDDKTKPGQPPRRTRFRKGVSGNPKGRPKGSKNLSTLLTKAARDQVIAKIDGKPRKISTLQAATMQMATKAAAGDPRSVGQFLDWIDEMETRAAKGKPQDYPISDADLAVITAVFNRLKPDSEE